MIRIIKTDKSMSIVAILQAGRPEKRGLIPSWGAEILSSGHRVQTGCGGHPAVREGGEAG
jgi:hypothetical protein